MNVIVMRDIWIFMRSIDVLASMGHLSRGRAHQKTQRLLEKYMEITTCLSFHQEYLWEAFKRTRKVYHCGGHEIRVSLGQFYPPKVSLAGLPSEVQTLVLQHYILDNLIRCRRRMVLGNLLARSIEPKLLVGVLSLADAPTVSRDYISYA